MACNSGRRWNESSPPIADRQVAHISSSSSARISSCSSVGRVEADEQHPGVARLAVWDVAAAEAEFFGVVLFGDKLLDRFRDDARGAVVRIAVVAEGDQQAIMPQQGAARGVECLGRE